MMLVFRADSDPHESKGARKIGMKSRESPAWNKTKILWILFLIVLLAGLVLLVWTNLRYAEAAPGGNDFLVHWAGMRAVLRGQSPYSDQTALEIQTYAYGRPALPGEHELRVAYPLYAELLFTPFSLITYYPLARALWMTVLEIAALAFALLAWILTGKKNLTWHMALFSMIAVLWYLGARALINGNAIVVVGLFLALSLYFEKAGRDWLVGIPLALSTIKPQVMFLPILGILLWMVFQRRTKAILSFLISMAFLMAISWLILPDWLAQNLREILRYPGYNPPGTPAAALGAVFGAGGNIAGWLISILAWMALVVLWLGLRGKGNDDFQKAINLTLILSPLAGLQTDAGNEFILLLPLAWLLADPIKKEAPSLLRFLGILGVVFFGLWWLFLATVQRGAQPVQNPLMLFPLPLFLIALYLWDRWRLRRRAINSV
jgi:hypothetical protein